MTATQPPAVNLVDPGPRSVGAVAWHPSPLPSGLWRFTDPDMSLGTRIVESDAGMALLDCVAPAWGNEETLGAVFHAASELRNRMILTTKGGIFPFMAYDSSPEPRLRALRRRGAAVRRLPAQSLGVRSGRAAVSR